MESGYYTYILYSRSLKRFYNGHSDDVDSRLKRHNACRVRSTKKGIPWNLLTQFESLTKAEAASLELRIKKRGAKRYLQDIAFSFEEAFDRCADG